MVKDRTVQLTPEGKTRLEAELRHLVEVKLPDLSARIQEASEHGDVSDNSEFEEVKEERVLTEHRIHELEQTLLRAEVIHRQADDDSVGLGSRVKLRTDDGEEETWTLVSPEEANTPEGAISTESPVGRALLGRRVGDAPVVETPGGRIAYTVMAIG